ncbi:hypothetical protein [Chondrinema litorale]|uniref:hypothetical protein n=1 Tax=Chondrinema litorale TaxID=2994555 RepID=UPI002542DCCC|nr:hypothetical protein [Chondrinema litorale]UZS00051.1 hypothetical protein OQ292_39620 [Chondrinema litorale]
MKEIKALFKAEFAPFNSLVNIKINDINMYRAKVYCLIVAMVLTILGLGKDFYAFLNGDFNIILFILHIVLIFIFIIGYKSIGRIKKTRSKEIFIFIMAYTVMLIAILISYQELKVYNALPLAYTGTSACILIGVIWKPKNSLFLLTSTNIGFYVMISISEVKILDFHVVCTMIFNLIFWLISMINYQTLSKTILNDIKVRSEMINIKEKLNLKN